MHAALRLALVLGTVLRAGEARADSANCRDGVLVETGYAMQMVYAKCGMPSHRVPQVGGNPRSEQWIYVPLGFHARVLQFYDGVLQRIRVMHG
jgi:hypothetical protein